MTEGVGRKKKDAAIEHHLRAEKHRVSTFFWTYPTAYAVFLDLWKDDMLHTNG